MAVRASIPFITAFNAAVRPTGHLAAMATNADLKAELQNTLDELAANFPGRLERARYLVTARHSGQSPGMHRWAGHMMPVTTTIPNLYNVGDGCTPPGTIGTEGSAASAREVVSRMLG